MKEFKIRDKVGASAMLLHVYLRTNFVHGVFYLNYRVGRTVLTVPYARRLHNIAIPMLFSSVFSKSTKSK